MMDPHRKQWNLQQQALRASLARPQEHQKAIDLFLVQHAMVHSAQMAGAGIWSFEDETLAGLTGAQLRLIPPGGEHSIAWLLWHMTRIEDVTMNLLVAGGTQVWATEGWQVRLKIGPCHTGNGMDAAGVADISAALDLNALREYRLSVGRRTRQVVLELEPDGLKKKVAPARLEQVRLEGAVLEATSELLDYWGGLRISGLLLMPPTRHPFIHWNEALHIRQKIRSSSSA